ncbi:MAG: hypothetical protein ABI809_04585 [Caldimonas sp.]
MALPTAHPARRHVAQLRSVALVLLGALHAAALACGACDEDKVAATYDHGVVAAARAAHRSVVYVAIEGPVDARAAAARIAREGERTPGIRRATLRVSSEPAAFSFVADRAQRPPDATLADLRRRIAMPGLRFSVVRIVHPDPRRPT